MAAAERTGVMVAAPTCRGCGVLILPRGNRRYCSDECHFRARVPSGDPDACWPWTGTRNRGGYGVLTLGGRTRLAHRVAHERAHGPIPAGRRIVHLCGAPACVNPAHLWDGVAPLDPRVRELYRRRRAEPDGRRRLTDTDVAGIRRLHRAGAATRRALAARFGVSRTHIDRIVNGRTRPGPEHL
jgi:hypothetical protein